MLKVDDRFKTWLRHRLKDQKYTEEFVRRTAELEDITIHEIWPHAALPYFMEDDPEAMIGMVKGHDNQQDIDFIVGIFGKQEDLGIVADSYIGLFWMPYHPVTRADFDRLPVIYQIAFTESDSEESLIRIRWVCSSEGKIIDEDAFKNHRINLINTKNDTDLIRMITGSHEDED